MVKEKNKSSIVTIVLFICLVMSIGYIVYDKIYSKHLTSVTNKEIEEKTLSDSVVSNESLKLKIGETRVAQSIWLSQFSKILSVNSIVSKNGEVYIKIGKGTEYNNYVEANAYYEEALANLQKQSREYKIDGYEPKYYDTGEEIPYKGIKLDIDNVIAAYEGYIGNGIDWHLYLLKVDGTISRVDIMKTMRNNGTISIENNVNNLKDIYTILQSGNELGYEMIAIDLNGNEHIIKN